MFKWNLASARTVSWTATQSHRLAVLMRQLVVICD